MFSNRGSGPRQFADRADAGRQLAAQLVHLSGPDLVVLGLPRGGVVVAAQVASALAAPLDVLIVRKLGHPAQPELAIGAISEGGVRVLTSGLASNLGVDENSVRVIEEAEAEALRHRVARLRSGRPPVDLAGQVALLVDDGIATGSTMRVACLLARQRGAARVVVAVPVAPAGVRQSLREADEVVCVLAPARFGAVGLYYRDFSQTTEGEVLALLSREPERGQGPDASDAGPDRG